MTKLLLPLLLPLFTLLSCSDDDNDDFLGAPNGQYRVVERICYCTFPNDGSIEYWIFDRESESMTIMVIDSAGQQLSNKKFYYGTKGKNLLIGDGREYSQKTLSGFLELTYLDSPGIADDELFIRLASY